MTVFPDPHKDQANAQLRMWHLKFNRAAVWSPLLAVLVLTACQRSQPTSSRPTIAPRTIHTPAQTTPPGSPSPGRTPVSELVPANAWTREAERWLGAPYRIGGMTHQGVDCSGFVLQLYHAVCGVRLPRTTQQQFQLGALVPASKLQPGDLLFFQTTGTGVSHVGVSVGGERFVHASASRGVIYSSLREDYYVRRFLGAKRVLN